MFDNIFLTTYNISYDKNMRCLHGIYWYGSNKYLFFGASNINIITTFVAKIK